MPDFYCTFGYGQLHAPGYVRITAPDLCTARKMMFDKYQENWCTSYSLKEMISPLDDIERDHIMFDIATPPEPN